MRLVVTVQGETVADVASEREAVYIGGREDCRVLLEGDEMPPQLAVVVPQGDGRWTLEPIATESDLTHNGAAVAAPVDLNEGDALAVAGYEIRVYPSALPGEKKVTIAAGRKALEAFARAKIPPGTIIKKPTEAIKLVPRQLDGAGQANVALSGCATVEDFMDGALQAVIQALGGQRAWMGVRRETQGKLDYVEGRLLTGQPTDMPPFGNELTPRALDRGQFLMVPRVSREDKTSALAGPVLSLDGTLGMIYVDNGGTGRKFDERDLDLFILLVNLISFQLEAIFNLQARTRAAMVAGHVSLAHEVQTRLAPRKLPQTDELQLGMFREPGRSRSGDVYDMVKMPNGLIAVLMGHTPASGVVPSMLMVQSQTAFRYGAMHQDTPNIFLRSLNWLMYDGQKDHPLHCCEVVLEPKSGKLRYALAGDVGACIIDARGEVRALRPEAETQPLGSGRNAQYELLGEQLETGETLALYTPGVLGATNRDGEAFGLERFLTILCDGFGQYASTTLKELIAELESFSEGGTRPEDITVILAHRV
jgi:serine phosphatase RsbU (regulator of sigma subunit)